MSVREIHTWLRSQHEMSSREACEHIGKLVNRSHFTVYSWLSMGNEPKEMLTLLNYRFQEQLEEEFNEY